mgnify:FL=1
MTIRVAVNGALGKMGKTVVSAVHADPELELVAAIDLHGNNINLSSLSGLEEIDLPVNSDLAAALKQTKPDVVIDFTSPFTVMQNIETALLHKVRPVVGTTGITEADLTKITAWSEQYQTPAFIAPNFAIGAVLMMLFSVQAAKFLPHVEIIELHHDQKLDAPSGTALKTAEMINKVRQKKQAAKEAELEKVPHVRGGSVEGIHIHSVRLPGYVAHQEVIFGGIGQTLSIRHDSMDRTSFIPGVLMSVKAVMKQEGVIYGLENILSL